MSYCRQSLVNGKGWVLCWKMRIHFLSPFTSNSVSGEKKKEEKKRKFSATTNQSREWNGTLQTWTYLHIKWPNKCPHSLQCPRWGRGGRGKQERRGRGGTSLSKVGQLKIFLLPFCFSVSDMSKARPTNVTAAVMPCGSLRASTIHLHLVAKRSRLSVYKGPTCTQSL